MSTFDEEIDLRPYLQSLIQRWWLILLIAAFAAIAALAISLLLPRKYEAAAMLLLTRSRTTLSLAEQFPTVNEPADTASRMSAILAIVQSDSIAQTIFQGVKTRLPKNIKTLQDFKELMSVSSQGDALLFSATSESPTLAAEIANAWANQAALAVNQAYRGEQPLADIQNQSVEAQKQYQEAQANLEAFLQNSQVDVLSKKVQESQAVFDKLAGNRAWQISYYDDRSNGMEALIAQAEALKSQLQRGNRSGAGDFGDALAVLDARASSLGINQSKMTMDLQMTDLSALKESSVNYVADLDAVIEQAKEEKGKAEATLNSLVRDVTQGQSPELFNEVAANLRDLKTQLEKENARQFQLTNERDIAWKAYQALLQKETEIESAPQVSNAVTLASAAVQPDKPTSRGTVRNVLVACVLGLIIGVFIVLAIKWWQSAETSKT
jgi:polysaccharide biosynthesis transport protein